MSGERVAERVNAAYEPPARYLERYADLLVNYALGGGTGIERGDAVQVIAPESAKSLYGAVCRAIWAAGGHVLGDYRPDDDHRLNLRRDFYEVAGSEQHAFFPEHYFRGLVDQIDHLSTSTVKPTPVRCGMSIRPRS